MSKIKFILLLFIAALLFIAPNSALAQMSNQVAVLPIQANGAISQELAKELYSKLEGVLAPRSDYIIIPAIEVKAKLTGVRGDVSSPRFLTKVGKFLQVEQLISLKLTVKGSSIPNRQTFEYLISYFDARGHEMIATTTGLCRDCDVEGLGYQLSITLEAVFAGPYILGLNTEPEGAKLSSDGEMWGVTPLQKVLPGGSYKILIEKEGYKSMEVEFPMPADRPIYATLPLTKDPDYLPPVALVLPPMAGQTEPVMPAETVPAKAKESPVTHAIKEAENKPAPEAAKIEAKPEPLIPATEELASDMPASESPIFKEPEQALVTKQMTSKRKWAWRLAGLSVGLLAGGAGLTYAAVNSSNKSDDMGLMLSTQEDYERRSTAYWASAGTAYALSTAAFVASMVLFFKKDKTDNNNFVIAPAIGQDQAGFCAMLEY